MRWLAAFIVFCTGIACFMLLPYLNDVWDNVLLPMVLDLGLSDFTIAFLVSVPIGVFALLLFAMFYLMFVKNRSENEEK